MLSPSEPVFAARCASYERGEVERVLRWMFAALGLIGGRARGKRVTIKPNLVMKMPPDGGGTTHPALVAAAARILTEEGALVTLAESPGGLYTEGVLRAVYRGCGMEEASREAGFKLNFDLTAREVRFPDGVASKMFHLISPVLDCDILLNFAKVKTHGLTVMSGAVKNFFGTIPGVEKPEMHARFPEEDTFEQMLLDLCAFHHGNTEVVNLLDAVVGMEGNGPTGGSPRALGVLLGSRNAANLDLEAAHLIGLENAVPLLEKAASRGYCPARPEDLALSGDAAAMEPVPFALPESRGQARTRFLLTFGGGRFKGLLDPRPVIDQEKCRGCGTCLRGCPQHTIVWEEREGKPRADRAPCLAGKTPAGAATASPHYPAASPDDPPAPRDDGPRGEGNLPTPGRVARILPKNCIRCYCCQELCPHRAVKIKQRAIMRLIGKIKF